jgi:hypothetical protein
MTTYTVIDHRSGEEESGLTVDEAAHIVLTNDGQEYEIREDEDGGFTLWSRHKAANQGWSQTCIFSIETDRAAAEADIFEKVVAAKWRGHPEVMTDEEYNSIPDGDSE